MVLLYYICWSRPQAKVKQHIKYKCFKTECPVCGNTGSCQLFINSSRKITYASQTSPSQPVSCFAVRKRLARNNQNLGFKELRSYYTPYLRKYGVLAEYVDLLQDRIPKSVFTRHYLKVEDGQEIVKKVTDETEKIESAILSNFIFCLSNVSQAKKPVSFL